MNVIVIIAGQAGPPGRHTPLLLYPSILIIFVVTNIFNIEFISMHIYVCNIICIYINQTIVNAIYIYIYIHTCIYRTNSELDIIKFGYQHLQLLNLS